MIKSISYWSFQNGLAGTHSIPEALKEAYEAGFEAVELAIGEEGAYHVDMTEQDIRSIVKNIENSNVNVPTVAAGLSWGCNPVSDDEQTRLRSIQMHTKALELTGAIGSKAMLMVPGFVGGPIGAGGPVRYDRAMQRLRQAIDQLLPVAEQSKVDLCLENVWNGLFYSPLELIDFVDSYQSSCLGVYLDVGNLLGYHQYPPHWIELLGHRIKRIHIKDYVENFGFVGGYAFNSLGAGQVPWPQTMQTLKDIGYDQTITAEMLPWDVGLLKRTSLEMDRILAMAR